jgi:hypothetical protein
MRFRKRKYFVWWSSLTISHAFDHLLPLRILWVVESTQVPTSYFYLNEKLYIIYLAFAISPYIDSFVSICTNTQKMLCFSTQSIHSPVAPWLPSRAACVKIDTWWEMCRTAIKERPGFLWGYVSLGLGISPIAPLLSGYRLLLMVDIMQLCASESQVQVKRFPEQLYQLPESSRSQVL